MQHQKWEGNTCPGKRNLFFKKLQKGELKTKTLLKIAILDAQSADRTKTVKLWSWTNIYLPKGGKELPQHHLKINSGFHARKNHKQQYLHESSHVQWCFIQEKPHLCLRPCSLNNKIIHWIDHPVHEKHESFNIS